MEIVLLFIVAVVGLGLTIAGYSARYGLPVELRGHTGLARISIGIVMMSVAVATPLHVVIEAIGSLGTV